MNPTPTFPRPGYDDDSLAAWLTSDEAAMLDALLCDDISVHITVSVKLAEYRNKRAPRKLTPEQEERESAASRHMDAYCRGLTSARRLLLALAAERKAARGGR